MGTKTIPQLGDASAPLALTDEFEVDQGAGSVKATGAQIAVLSGWTKIASGTITVPVSFVDLSLPAGYVKFRLELQEILMDMADQLSFQLSSDGGMTFHSSSGNYHNTQITYAYGEAGSSADGQSFADTQGTLIYDAYDGGAAAKGASMASVEIWPGSSISYALVNSHFCGRLANNDMPGIAMLGNALVAEVARQNFIRIGPYFGDGVNWIAGSYVLLGLSL